MTIIEGKSFFTVAIDLDNKRFVRCKFSNCTLRYKGGQVEWDKDTSFEGCRWEFFEHAQRTIEVRNVIVDVLNFRLSNEAFSTH